MNKVFLKLIFVYSNLAGVDIKQLKILRSSQKPLLIYHIIYILHNKFTIILKHILLITDFYWKVFGVLRFIVSSVLSRDPLGKGVWIIGTSEKSSPLTKESESSSADSKEATSLRVSASEYNNKRSISRIPYYKKFVLNYIKKIYCSYYLK